MELLSHLLFLQRTHATIDDVTCYQDKIRLLGIHQIHPFGEILTGVMITQMKVGSHHYLILARQGF